MINRCFVLSFLTGFLLFATASDRPCGSDSPRAARLVINSHASYRAPRKRLLASLRAVGFEDFCRVLLVVGGARAERAPRRLANLTVATTSAAAFDYTAMGVLRAHSENALVRAPAYLYLPDTSEALPGFAAFFAGLPVALGDAAMLVAPLELDSNILAFGPALLEACGDRFRGNVSSKKDAVFMELRHAIRCGVPDKRTAAAPAARLHCGQADPYATGAVRECYRYPDFFVLKYMCKSVAGCPVERAGSSWARSLQPPRGPQARALY
jgi:hypothetical protein